MAEKVYEFLAIDRGEYGNEPFANLCTAMSASGWWLMPLMKNTVMFRRLVQTRDLMKELAATAEMAQDMTEGVERANALLKHLQDHHKALGEACDAFLVTLDSSTMTAKQQKARKHLIEKMKFRRLPDKSVVGVFAGSTT